MSDNFCFGKKLAVIGAGIAAKPILVKAKEMGVITYCFSTIKGATAREYSDYFYEYSIFDVEGILNELRRLKVDGIIASSEITTEVTAIIADKLKLPGNDISNGFLARNKYLMRNKISLLSNVSQPKYELYSGTEWNKYPVVVKSVDSFGKKGISIARNKSEFDTAVLYAKENSLIGAVLVEEYIENGKEFSVECLVSRGKNNVIQITEKDTSGPPHFVELGHHQPANINTMLRKKIEDVADDILDILGIRCGMAHLEIIVKDGIIYFLEVGARAGGDYIAEYLVGLSTNYDYYRGAIEASLDSLSIVNVKNIAYSGIYFLCYQTKDLLPLFRNAKAYSWCYKLEINSNELYEIVGNSDKKSGYLIYSADHKIVLDDVKEQVTLLNKCPRKIFTDFNKKICDNNSNFDELQGSVDKFIKYGNILGIISYGELIAMLNLYCNNYETKEAYICNVYVLDKHRRKGLARKLLNKAYQICEHNSFVKIFLHVAESNYKAIALYKSEGFSFTGNIKTIGNVITKEMCRKI